MPQVSSAIFILLFYYFGTEKSIPFVNKDYSDSELIRIILPKNTDIWYDFEEKIEHYPQKE